MYKVMIVDDEILVRIGLRSMIDWEKLGFQIVDEASNGESAYEKFMVSRPDVILTDIKMPLRDGLWLIEKVKKEKPETEIVILTAYDDFDYARKAVKLQASEYLLKAEMEEQEVEKVMISLREKLDKAKKEMESDTLSVKSEDGEQQERLLGLMLSEYKPISMVKEQFDKLNIPWNMYECCFVQFDFQEAMQEKEYANEQVVSIISACRQLINARFQSRYRYCIMKQFGKSITLLLMNERLSQEKLEEDIRELQASIHQYFDITFKSANSRIETNIEKVRENAAWIFQVSQRLFYIQAGQHEVQKMEKIYNKEETEGEVYTEGHITRLAECVINTDEETASAILEEIRENSLRRLLVPLDLKLKMVQLMNSVERICHTYLQEKSEELLEYQKKTLQAEDMEMVFGILRQCMECMMNAVVNSTLGNAEQFVEMAKAWVELHYAERIGLEEVAKQVGISQYYFSNLFRKTEGKKFSSYLNEVRIGHARDLLIDPKITVAQVSEMVGFNDQPYFSKTFKKYTGITVTEFREQNGS